MAFKVLHDVASVTPWPTSPTTLPTFLAQSSDSFPILVHNKGPPKDLCSCCCLCLKHLSPKQAYNSLPLFFQSLPKCNHSLWSSSASALTLCPLTLLYDFHRPYHSLHWNGFFHLPSLDCNLNESRDCFIHSRIPQNPAQCLACAIEYPVPISPCWMNTWIL